MKLLDLKFSTPARTLSISGLKSRVLKLTYKIDDEKWSRIFYFEIGLISLKGLGEFRSKKILAHISLSLLSQKW